jgi:geranylgeranyl diphosphate synthase type II
MDKSDFRRNRPTVHKKWNESIAILTGDAMIGFAYRLIPIKNAILK